MKYLNVLVISSAAILGACAVNGTHAPLPNTLSAGERLVDFELPQDQALLLVSLDDGTVIKQTIHSEADICFKVNNEALTTCLSEGAPVIDPQTESVIGYEMIEQTIELVAKTQQ